MAKMNGPDGKACLGLVRGVPTHCSGAYVSLFKNNQGCASFASKSGLGRYSPIHNGSGRDPVQQDSGQTIQELLN